VKIKVSEDDCWLKNIVINISLMMGYKSVKEEVEVFWDKNLKR